MDNINYDVLALIEAFTALDAVQKTFSPQQFQIIALKCMGKSNKDIAVILEKKHANICNQVERITHKTLKTIPHFVQNLPLRVGGGNNNTHNKDIDEAYSQDVNRHTNIIQTVKQAGLRI